LEGAGLSDLQRAFEQLSPGECQLLLSEIDAELGNRRLEFYRPNAKQAEFHRLGKIYRQRLLVAGSQCGKTMSAGAETAMHVTGRYPNWWEGKVFDKATVGWVAGVTNDALRDGVQRMLFGRTDKTMRGFGTGMIPADAMTEKPSWKVGSNSVIDTMVVRHGGGGDIQAGHSIITQKAYEQGRKKFQADTLHWGWADEEPPFDIYQEMLTRTNATQGPMFTTFTPLMGYTETVSMFLKSPSPDMTHVRMTIMDTTHYSEEEKRSIIASYPAHEREARTLGKPSVGEGRIFPIAREQIAVEPFVIPSHWVHILGMDIGGDHPTAFAWLVWDRDTDTLYLIATYRQGKKPDGTMTSVAEHAQAIKRWGGVDAYGKQWIPVAWPHDGSQIADRSGQNNGTYAQLYTEAGLNMLPHLARFDDLPNGDPGGHGLEAGVSELNDRMLSGRFKVFSHLGDFWEEFEMFHRVNGRIIDKMDDVLSATRYGMMMKRYAAQRPRPKGNRQINPGSGDWRTA
jgi:phage terminase large subunit-like protein